jgi:hypothetical protein
VMSAKNRDFIREFRPLKMRRQEPRKKLLLSSLSACG